MSRRLDMLLDAYWLQKRERSKNPLVRRGEKFFSQADEDGILLEICRRIGKRSGAFVEIGVGDGLENNSLILLMHGWKGVWISAEPLAFQVPEDGPLFFQEAVVTRDNVASLVEHGRSVLGLGEPDVLSIDVDGNDVYLLETLLAGGVASDILICEYNAKFPPPIRWAIRYDEEHRWDGSDYQGASLQSLVDVAQRFGYRLVACNLTGANAFFVHTRHAPAFADVPTAVEELFVAADYCWFYQRGHTASPLTIARFLGKSPGDTP